MPIVVFEISTDGGLQFASAAMNPAAQLLFGKQAKPALDQVEPRSGGGSEVQVEARMAQKPALDGWSLVGAVIIEDQMQLQFVRHCGVDSCKEAAKLARAVALMELANHGAGAGVERGEQVGGGMAPLGLTGAHRQQRLTAVERLNLRFLIHAQHQCPVRRIKIQAHDVADFFDEQRGFGELETLDSVRLQGKGPPDAADYGLTHSAAPGQRASAPVRRISGEALQGQSHDPLNLRVTDLARRPGPRLVQQPVQPPRHKALPPFADGLVGYPKLVRYRRVGITGRALQNHARALRQRLRALGPPRPTAPESRALRPSGSKVLSVSPSASASFLPLRKTPAAYNLFNVFLTQDTSCYLTVGCAFYGSFMRTTMPPRELLPSAEKCELLSNVVDRAVMNQAASLG